MDTKQEGPDGYEVDFALSIRTREELIDAKWAIVDRYEPRLGDGYEMGLFPSICTDHNLSIRTRIDLKFGTLAFMASHVVSCQSDPDPDSEKIHRYPW